MISKPYILIPMRKGEQTRSESSAKFYGVWDGYIQKIYKFSAIPLMVPPSIPSEMLEDVCARAQGLFLTGGEDISPSQYNAERHPETKSVSEERDRLELELARRFMRDRKPILGICRGSNVLSVVEGGSLIQHIPDLKLDEQHGSPDPSSPMSHHQISFVKNTKLKEIVGKDSITVNSHHHQSIKTPGDNFVVAATSPKGIVEAIEHKDRNYFCIGIQSHPEVENGGFEKVFEAFVEACRRFKD